jgi:hypothetical protein
VRRGRSILLPALLAAALLVAVPAVTLGQTTKSAPAAPTPRWVLHAQRHPGSLSGTVQVQASPDLATAQARGTGGAGGATSAARAGGQLRNVQMNDDSNPPLPQNETSVAYNVFDPRIAVAASNDYVSAGVAVMRTSNGGRTWETTRITSVFAGTTDTCSGGDPSVAYSRRDHAFYVAQLCFFRTLPFSEVKVHKSVDNGKTWTPGRQAARAATNFDYSNRTVDDTIFNDKEYITVDNNPSSPHYGRLYVSYTKFHLTPDGSSDFCPIQLSYTDNVPTTNPALTVFQHTPVVPDNPGGNGLGESANQHSVPVVQRDGTLDIGYILEDCNTALDFGFRFQKSSDGGATFLASPVHVDKPGQFVDNPDPADLLPPTRFRAPNTLSVAYSQASGTLVFLYQNNVNRAQSKADISFQRSVDGGLTWSDARFLSVDAQGNPAAGDQFFPWAAADQNGRFVAIWFDRRLDPNNHDIDTWQAESTNDGVTWKSFRISSQSWNPDIGFFSSGAFIGDYNGLAASTTAVYPVWTDGRNSAFAETGIGETDIFTNVER